ncbi:MAG: hypothetical protein DWQ01_15985 [Planctomycetota bacterium]|nr:MAG: hypothetical protein DWQ01_15985 [Planctomycetota bacterium]
MKNTIIVVAICALITLVGIFAPVVFNVMFDGLDLALGWMGPFLAVCLLSAVIGVLFILAFPHVSSQKGIAKAKDSIKVNLIAIRLFQDNFKVVMASLGKTLSWNFVYLGMFVLPILVMGGPFTIFWYQFNALYAFDSLKAGDQVMVVAELKQGVKPHEVEVPLPGEGAWKIVQGPVAVQDSKVPKVVLQVEAVEEGSHEVAFEYQGQSLSKALEVGTTPRRLSPVRSASASALMESVLYYGEPMLKGNDFIQTIEMSYPDAPLGPTPGGIIWIMVVFVLVTVVVGFGLKGILGVEM